MRVQKRDVGQAVVKEEAKNEKELFSEYVGQVMVKSVKKRRFSEYVGQVMAKDADG